MRPATTGSVPLLRFLLLACLVTLAPASVAAAQERPFGDLPALTPEEAAGHVGRTVSVCGKVVSATYAAGSRGRPTFLNLDRPYPDHVFTIVIWGEDRGEFEEPPERVFRGKEVCVRGRIETYRGTPRIVVRDPAQIGAAETARTLLLEPTGGMATAPASLIDDGSGVPPAGNRSPPERLVVRI